MLKIIPITGINDNEKNTLEALFESNADLEDLGIYSIGYEWNSTNKNFIIIFNNQIIGQCGFGTYSYNDPNETDDRNTTNVCSTYVWIDKYYRGLGLGYQVGGLLTEYIFKYSHYTNIRKVAFDYNRVSVKNITKQGFKFEKQSGKYLFFNLTKDEYKELKNGCCV